MEISQYAGKSAHPEILTDIDHLCQEYFDRYPDIHDPKQRVQFGTSGHRGTSLNGSYQEAHVLAITQAICDFRHEQNIQGPLFLGKDTHALSGPSQKTTLEVLAANGIETFIQSQNEVTPTPVISHAILTHNFALGLNFSNHPGRADGIIITPSHNPPEDGGFKYNPPQGGPADTTVTTHIQNRANEYLKNNNIKIKRLPYEKAIRAACIHETDFLMPYLKALPEVIDLACIRDAKIKIGVDPLGGASLRYWETLKKLYDLDLTVVNEKIDPQFSFMPVDHDGKIRMDCSSAFAMTNLILMKDRFQIAFGNDADADRHGIITSEEGLVNSNHYLAVCIDYLLTHRPQWRKTSRIGKTLVSSSMIDQVVSGNGRALLETPVGFKWFAPGLLDASLCFGGEESAGASFLKLNGTAWTSDKDGIILNLLAAEILSKTGKNPSVYYQELVKRHGIFESLRIDTPITPQGRASLLTLSPESIKLKTLAGETILQTLTHARELGAALGGVKIVAQSGWFAVRPSGTEMIYKIYAESFLNKDHLNKIVAEAKAWVDSLL